MITRFSDFIKTIFLTAGWAGVYLPDALNTVAHEDEPHYYANISLGLQQELAALTASGRKVVLMEDVPGLTFDPMWQIRDELIPARQVVERALFDAETTHVGGRSIPRQAVDGSENQLTRQRIEMLPAQFPGLTILDPTKVLCEGDRCMFADSHGPFYADSTHLNSRGSAELLPLISDAHL
jgi:hypothetical protein